MSEIAQTAKESLTLMQKESMTYNQAAKRFTRRKKNKDARKVIHRKNFRNRSKKRVLLFWPLFDFFLFRQQYVGCEHVRLNYSI